MHIGIVATRPASLSSSSVPGTWFSSTLAVAQMPSSCARACSSDNRGGNVRRVCFARGLENSRRICQAHRRSITFRMASHNLRLPTVAPSVQPRSDLCPEGRLQHQIFQIFHVCKEHAESGPHSSLPLVQPDAREPEQSVEIVNRFHSRQLTQQVSVVKESAQLLPLVVTMLRLLPEHPGRHWKTGEASVGALARHPLLGSLSNSCPVSSCRVS